MPRARELFVQNDLVWRVDTGGIGHVLLAGIEYGDQSTRNERVNGFFDGRSTTTSSRRRTAVDLADPLLVPDVTFRAGAGNRSVRSEADVLAVYAQDQLSIGEGVELVAASATDVPPRGDRPLTGAAFVRTDDLWSPRLGLVLKPVATVSLYASYSRSYCRNRRPIPVARRVAGNLGARTLRQLRSRCQVEPAARPAGDRRRLPARPRQQPRPGLRSPGTTVLTGAQRSEASS
jgi:outer membrane receptor for monomeric catechols